MRPPYAPVIAVFVVGFQHAGAQPEFVVTPFEVPPGIAGSRPAVLHFGHIALDGLPVTQIAYQVSEQTGANEEHAASPTSDGRADYRVGLEWETSPTRIAARCYAASDVLTRVQGESSEIFASAHIDSPTNSGGPGREPRFTLTQDALVHVRVEARDVLAGTIMSNNTSYSVSRVDPETGQPDTIIQDAAPQFPIHDRSWFSGVDEVVPLPSGDYHLQMYVVHLGTAAMFPDTGFSPSIFADGEITLELRILPGCSLADLSEPLGALDFSDVTAFLLAFAAGAPEADLAPPIGGHDFSDVTAFLSAFGAGCP